MIFLTFHKTPGKKMVLEDYEWEMIVSGLNALADQADHDAEFGGSDEPEVPRKIAVEARDLARRIDER